MKFVLIFKLLEFAGFFIFILCVDQKLEDFINKIEGKLKRRVIDLESKFLQRCSMKCESRYLSCTDNLNQVEMRCAPQYNRTECKCFENNGSLIALENGLMSLYDYSSQDDQMIKEIACFLSASQIDIRISKMILSWIMQLVGST